MQGAMLSDHEGKRSSARFVSVTCGLTLCALAVGAMLGAAMPPETLMYLVAAGALGPVGLNRFGERLHERPHVPQV